MNFLFAPGKAPHLTAGELCALFGVGQSTGAARAGEIRKTFKMYQLDPEWCLPSKLDQNPLVWMIEVDGFIVDVRHTSREIQEQALRLGLIPYLSFFPSGDFFGTPEEAFAVSAMYFQ